jgi:hypothetical protein
MTYEWPSEVRLNLRDPPQAALSSVIQRFWAICVRRARGQTLQPPQPARFSVRGTGMVK